MNLSKAPIESTFDIIDYLKDNLEYQPASIILKWDYSKTITYKKVLFLELHTCGWSNNEVIIDDLMQNQMFALMWHTKWHRGGHYYFEIQPEAIGYKTVSETAKAMNCSRQYIHKIMNQFDWVLMGKKILLIRKKVDKSITNPK